MKRSPKNISEYFKMLFYLEGSEKEHERIISEKSDDPYFYDAYEGIKDIDLQERVQIIKNLNEKIDAKVRANRKFGLPLLKVAAGLAILAGISFWMINLSQAKKQVVFAPNKSSLNKIALPKTKLESPIESTIAQTVDSIPKNQSVATNIESIENIENVVSQTSDQIAAVGQTQSNSTQFNSFEEQNFDYIAPEIRYESPGTRIIYKPQTQAPYTSNTPIQSSPIQSTSPMASKPQEEKVSSNSIADAFSSETNIGKADARQKEGKNIAEREEIIAKLDQTNESNTQSLELKKLNGTVTDQNNDPIFGVTVIAEQSMNGTSTDANGNFNLEGLIEGETLSFSYVGFEEVQKNYDGNPSMKVSLNSQTELSEVIVDASIAERSTESITNDEDGMNAADGALVAGKSNENLKFAKPASGWKTFKTMIEKNRRYPSEAIENNIEGRVIISFFVDKNGQLSDFQVKKSLGYGCDDEAIRLLKNGPPWDAGATNTRAEYTFRFK